MIFFEKEIMQPALFKDRLDGGQKLASELKKLDIKNPVVIAIPSGGIPVGLEIAKELSCSFDLIIVRKIQYPETTEAGFGAVTADGTYFLNPRVPHPPAEVIKIQAQKAIKEVRHREKEFLKDKKRTDIKHKTAILVDDGLAAGSTMVAAVRAVKKREPAQIIVAVPTASGGAIELLEKEADKIITLYQHPKHVGFAVASSYKEWHDLSDKEVKKYLKSAKE